MGEDEAGRPTILLVDDNHTLCSALSWFLGQSGYRVRVCGDGAEAVRYVREEHGSPDLMLLDVQLPTMTGLECYRQLRLLLPALRVLVMTGGGDCDDDVLVLRQEGVQGVLSKPLPCSELLAAVREFLGPGDGAS